MSSTGGSPSETCVEKYFGLELLFKSCKDTLKSKSDALVLLAHYLLVRSGKRCHGIGEQWTQGSKGTELLPDKWNDNQSLYTLRYASIQGSERYVLKVIPSGGFLLVNVLNVRKERTASTNVTMNKFASGKFEELSRAYKSLDDLISKLNTEVVSVLDTIDSTTQASSSREASRMVSQENNPLHIPSRQPGIEWSPLQEVPRVGQRDLNPFYQGPPGGGMLMDPRQLPRPHHSDPGVGIPGIPRGSIPPGARFDPFGPPRPDAPGTANPRFAGPNPDHLRPPPDYDDMFS
ncbi:proteasome inhibitor PI31 subunit-like [Dermacentor andersoni]|uniref:proteasome inhibitor PI31 subunit-like n=1 Tax=Dermacentor andersoni TaxID=34620 RepID=UPI002155CB29|nr:proteasome inhibitor PI31 subunit-like [Dermacentor andersoni]